MMEFITSKTYKLEISPGLVVASRRKFMISGKTLAEVYDRVLAIEEPEQ